MALAVDRLPTTRYRGSKRKSSMAIGLALLGSRPTRLFDAFGGSGTVSLLADQLEIPTQFSDIYTWVVGCARTLLVHQYDRVDLADLLGAVDSAVIDARPGFISRTFRGCYFTSAENLELDGLSALYEQESCQAARDLILYGVAQAALAKLPMALFHRACLKQRVSPVERRNGNLSTWNTPFRVLVPHFMREAAIFTWTRKLRHRVLLRDATAAVPEIKSGEAIFLDPPYVSPDGHAPTYLESYHFLEGFAVGVDDWQRGLRWGGSHPIFLDSARSNFETRDGWINGVASLARAGRNGTVLGTARARDSPGASDLRFLLVSSFRDVHRSVISKRTIFTDRPNREYLFTAS